MTKAEDTKAEPKADKKAKAEEPTWLSIHETGLAASRKEPMEQLPPGHEYADRVKAQAKALGIGEQEGETLEHLMFRIRMGGSA